MLSLTFLLFLGLPEHLFVYLPVDEISLKPLLLYALDVVHLELVELLTDGLDVLLLPVELRDQLALHLLVIRLHLRTVQLLPFLLKLLFMIDLPLFVFLLNVSLSEDIRHEELALECLDYVLVLIGLLICALHHLHALLLLQLKFHRIYTTTLKLLSFKASIAFFLTLFAEGLHGVGPVGNASL